MPNSELAKFTASIDAAWKDLHSFLAGVTPSQALKRDPAGWSVKDHPGDLAGSHAVDAGTPRDEQASSGYRRIRLDVCHGRRRHDTVPSPDADCGL
jgi:hypothetical protein